MAKKASAPATEIDSCIIGLHGRYYVTPTVDGFDIHYWTNGNLNYLDNCLNETDIKKAIEQNEKQIK
jgi:hypothetical protein